MGSWGIIAGAGIAIAILDGQGLAAKATEEIQAQNGTIQAETECAVSAIGTIRGTIEGMSEINTSIAAAVEDQGAADGTRKVSSVIGAAQEDGAARLASSKASPTTSAAVPTS